MINPASKKLGYYVCNGIDFLSKVDALLYASTVNQPVEWMFHQDTFRHYPWHIEPSETLDQLYDRRARQLREQYDYIVLSYSGGADTNNILESFIRQGLHIDEILINHMTRATKGSIVLNPAEKSAWNFNAEHQLHAVPRLQYIHKMLPRTKITELDVSDTVVNSLKQFGDASWVVGRGDCLTVGQLFRYNYFHFGQIKKQMDQGQRVAMILGIDKPRTKIKDDLNFYVSFADAVAGMAAVNDHNTEYDNMTTELFYWHPDCADMICKQAHVIKRWIENNPEKLPYWKNATYQTVRHYHERWLRSLLYTTWDDSWFQADKAIKVWVNEFDAWFWNNPELNREKDIYQQGIKYLIQHMPGFVKKNGTGQSDGFQTFVHDYCVGKINPQRKKLMRV
jgi:hypothetical protein